MRRLLLAVVLLLLTAVAPAWAVDANQVAAVLRDAPVYQAAGVDLVDVGALTSELDGSAPRVVVAVLAADEAGSDAEARQRAIEIGRALGESDAVVLVITASNHLGAGQGQRAADRGVDAQAALRAERVDGAFTKTNLTAFVTSFAERVANQAGADRTGEDQSGDQSPGGAGPLLPLLVVGGIGAGGYAIVRSGRRRKAELNEGLRAEVEQLYERLANDVLTISPGDDKVARQAMADASERYSACGGQLATADSPAELAAARRTAIEGLTAARTARTALGLDPGPEIPPMYGTGPQLDGERRVTVDGQDYDGAPEYSPGRPHYYEGGRVGGQQVPGGWYSGNFWGPLLLGSILTGGFGGGFGGGGGFERGYEEGYEQGQGSGGDWGGGGGDWGGGGDAGGGGDW